MFTRLWRIYEYVYSALYEWNIRRWHGDDYMASFMTAAGLAGALTMNVGLLTGLWVSRYGSPSITPVLNTPLFFSLIPISFLALNYVAFIRGARYEALAQRFQTAPVAVQKRTRAVAWAYILMSYGFPILYAFGMLATTNKSR